TDVLNLEVKLAQAREDLIRAQNGVQLAIAALNTAIGRDLVGPDGLSEAEKNLDPPPASEDLDAAAARPELKAARAVAGLREKAWKSSRREHVPVVNAFGSLDWDSEELSDFEQSYMAGVMAEWDIFTGFRKSQAAREARAQWQAARAEETRALNNLRLDLKQAHLQAGEAWQRLDVARKTVASAEEAWRITRERYEQGAADITELLTAEVGLTATRSRNVAAYYDYLVARSNLLRARGELVVKYAATESR
ncbi:MAG: TolC family protein, partial [Kiritimatiellae bacterium]|nr:TolC family protein [Kiritimatiellia bacterium]